MDARTAGRIESAADVAAATLFAVAVGYVVSKISGQVSTSLAALPAFALCFAALRRIQPLSAVPDLVAPDRPTQVTNLLAEADRSIAHAADELVLDDILAALKPDSRVVQLFEHGATATPGDLRARIDNHLQGSWAASAPDASQELHDALAELRRSLN